MQPLAAPRLTGRARGFFLSVAPAIPCSACEPLHPTQSGAPCLAHSLAASARRGPLRSPPRLVRRSACDRSAASRVRRVLASYRAARCAALRARPRRPPCVGIRSALGASLSLRGVAARAAPCLLRPSRCASAGCARLLADGGCRRQSARAYTPSRLRQPIFAVW